MAAMAIPSTQFVSQKPCISASHKMSRSSIAFVGNETKGASFTKLRSLSLVPATQTFSKTYSCKVLKFESHGIKAMAASTDKQPLPGLPIDLRGRRAFIAGIADDNGYGWAIAKSLAGAEILVGTWVPALNIFETSLRRGKFDESRVLPDGSSMEITKVYPLDAVYDSPEDVPEDEVVESVKQDFGTIDILVHSHWLCFRNKITFCIFNFVGFY
ncbi:hypothetical protein ACS0TY_000780 [Phlomoides rotata]